MRVKPGGFLVALLSCGALAAPTEKVAQVQRLFDDLEVEAASKAADDAVTQGGLDRASLLQLYVLQGLARATLNRPVPARDAFFRALLLDPSWTLPKNQPPRVKTPFFEAKGMATENGVMAAEGSSTTAPGRVTSLMVTMLRDPLKLGKAVRFIATVDGVERTERLDLVEGGATLAISGAKVRWRAVVYADKDNELFEVGSEASPLEVQAPPAATVAAVAPGETVRATPSAPGSGWKRPVGFSLLGAGAAAGIVGVIFGARSDELRGQLKAAERNEAGVIVGLTQREAFALDADAQRAASTANVLYVSAGVVAAAGLGLVLWSLGDPVTVAPAAGGVVVSGSF